MQRGALLDRLRASSGPALRVIGLTYTGLGGMIALALIVSVAVVPVAPALQQVAEPARQAVSSLVQPTSDAVTVFFGAAPAVHVEVPAVVSSPTVLSGFSEVVSLDVTIEDAPTEPTTVDEPMPVVPTTVIRAPAAEAQSPAEEAVDEIVGLEPIEVSAPHAVEPIVVVVHVPTAGIQIASADPPKALPTPVPTETASQIKARLDAENQAAIDAAKAAQVRAKAEADAANNAAIAALKAAATATVIANNAPTSANNAPVAEVASVTGKPSATVTVEATSVTAATATPKGKNSEPATPTATATPQSKAAANAANQAAIDAAKATQVRAKADANAANQAALLAAKGAKSSAKITPTAQPTAAPAQPKMAQVTPSPVVVKAATTADVTAEGHAAGVTIDGTESLGADVVTRSGDEASLESVPVDQAQTPSDAV